MDFDPKNDTSCWMAEADLAAGLEALVTVQQVGAKNLPAHLLAFDDADFRTAALGAFVELGELVNESRWKPWRSYDRAPSVADRQRILKEFGDVLHFVAWLMASYRERFGLSTDDFATAFMEVAAENRRRFTGQIEGREPPAAATAW